MKGEKYMDEQTYDKWWSLHVRVAKGETLGGEEQAIYLEGQRSLRSSSAPEGQLDLLRRTRADIRAMEADREQLDARRSQLRDRIAVLEMALSEKDKQAIGVGN
jgi:hypothetical protein